MALKRPAVRTPVPGDLPYALAWLLSVLLLIPTQLASLILFDSTGLDVPTPYPVFMAVVPAIALALLPTLAARYLYTRRSTRITAAVAFVAFALAAAYTMQFYGTCGPGC